MGLQSATANSFHWFGWAWITTNFTWSGLKEFILESLILAILLLLHGNHPGNWPCNRLFGVIGLELVPVPTELLLPDGRLHLLIYINRQSAFNKLGLNVFYTFFGFGSICCTQKFVLKLCLNHYWPHDCVYWDKCHFPLLSGSSYLWYYKLASQQKNNQWSICLSGTSSTSWVNIKMEIPQKKNCSSFTHTSPNYSQIPPEFVELLHLWKCSRTALDPVQLSSIILPLVWNSNLDNQDPEDQLANSYTPDHLWQFKIISRQPGKTW